MLHRPNRQWLDVLRWLAYRPRGSALAAAILLGLFAALIGPPVIEGSMVDQISGTNEPLEVSRLIQVATGGQTTAVVIATPAAVSIDALFADLTALRSKLAAQGDHVELRSIDSARDQLFLYNLSGSEPVRRLLGMLRDNREATTIISADGAHFLLILSFPERLEEAVLDVLASHRWTAVYDRHRILAGAQLENDIAAALMSDLWLLIPTIIITMLIALFAAFRRWRALLLPGFVSIAATVVTFALFSLTSVTINLVTLLALPIVLIVGLANSCHFLATSGSAVEDRADIMAAVALTMRRVGPPFFFSSLTTSAALVSLSLNDIPPIANLGRLSAAALMLVFVLVILAAPLCLRWYLGGSTRSWRESKVFTALSAWLVTRRTQISGILVLAMVAGAMAVPLLTIRSDPRSFFPDGAPFSAAHKVFEREFYAFSPLRLLVSAEAVEADALFALRQAAVLRQALAEHPDVHHVTIQPAISDNSAYVLSALLAHRDALPPVVAYIEEVRSTMPQDVAVIYTSASMVYSEIDRQAMDSLLRSLGWSVAVIFGALLLVFRSLRAVLATMLANGVPLMLVCGAIWLIGNPLNLVTVFVFLVALGVIVDDAIHILFARAAGDTLAGSSIEFSVLLSTTMLCLGLLLCQLSDFPTTREFSAYCAIALVGAVISNLTVLPLALGSSGGGKTEA